MLKTRLFFALLLLLVTMQSAFFFLVKQKLSLPSWLCFNACALANITFLLGFALFLLHRSQSVQYMAVLPLFFFGTLGLFFFPWSGMNIIVQLSHVIMTVNCLLLLLEMFQFRDFRAGIIGLLLGILFFAPFIGWQQNYAHKHAAEFQQLFNFKF